MVSSWARCRPVQAKQHKALAASENTTSASSWGGKSFPKKAVTSAGNSDWKVNSRLKEQNVCLPAPLVYWRYAESQSRCPSLPAVIYHIPTPVTGHWPWLGMESLLHLQRAQIIPRQPEEIAQGQSWGPGPRTPGLSRAVVIYVRSSRAQNLCLCIRDLVSPGELPQTTGGFSWAISIFTAGQEGAGWDGTPGALAHGGLGILTAAAAHPSLKLQKCLKGALAMSDGAQLAWGMWAHILLNQEDVGQRNPSEKECWVHLKQEGKLPQSGVFTT